MAVIGHLRASVYATKIITVAMNVNTPIDIFHAAAHIIDMDRDEFRRLLDRCGIPLPLLAKLAGRDYNYLTTVGRKAPVGQHFITIAEAWHLMDGPKRQELLKAIER